MKLKIILLNLSLLLPLYVCAQVRVIEAPKTNANAFRYDSTKNYQSIVDYYIGQDLFVIPHSEKNKRRNESANFYKNVRTSSSRTTITEGILNYGDVQGRTFHVIGKENNLISGSKFGDFMILIDKENGDTVYYKFHHVSEHNFPFIVLGYKEKYERSNKNKKFIYRSFYLRDFNTGETILPVNATTWTFTEIIAIPDINGPCYLLINDNGITTAVEKMDDFIPKDEIDSYIKKYGKSMVETALRGDIKIGMSWVLVRIAKGSPKRINTSSYGEQWVYGEYGDDCIYFENGKVTGWN